MAPSGFRRSRALWENCYSRPYYQVDNNNTRTTTTWSILQQQRDKFKRYSRAILYELQPLRYSIIISSLSSSLRYFVHLISVAIASCRKWIPYIFRQVINTFRSLTWDQWKWVVSIALYYVFLRWIHETLDAGPVVLIVTLLIIIFTVGLSDQNDTSGLSAYSVFNKGFQSIMGSIDADDLLQQHLGGGGIMQMIHHRRPQMEDNIDVEIEPPNRRARQQNVRRGYNNADDVDEDRPAEINHNQNRARRTGKKARRDRVVIEQRREIRAQRDAALALGFGHNDDDDLVAGRVDRQDGAAFQNDN
jgi:Uncharacterized conserved domain (SAYSvFN)